LRFNKNPIKHLKIKYVEKDNYHVISIVDNGIGIAENYHDKIFEMFERLQNRKHYRGSGLGLSLCKKIVEGHQGKIWVENNPSGGSIFHVKLPVKRPINEKVNINFSSGERNVNVDNFRNGQSGQV